MQNKGTVSVIRERWAPDRDRNRGVKVMDWQSFQKISQSERARFLREDSN